MTTALDYADAVQVRDNVRRLTDLIIACGDQESPGGKYPRWTFYPGDLARFLDRNGVKAPEWYLTYADYAEFLAYGMSPNWGRR